ARIGGILGCFIDGNIGDKEDVRDRCRISPRFGQRREQQQENREYGRGNGSPVKRFAIHCK
ncbi:MAG: hypothetical protein VW931_09505, partial [Alphaproteobacteria bacterium]